MARNRLFCDHQPYADKDRVIRLKLKHVLVLSGLGVLRGLQMMKNGLGLFFGYGLGKPLAWIGRASFRMFLLPIYKWYLSIRQRVKIHPRLEGVRSFGHFLERYAVYAVLVALGVLAVGDNIFARTIRPDEIGRGTIWASFVSSETSDLIVETAAARPMAAAKSTALAIGGTPQPSNTNSAALVQPITDLTAPVLAVGNGLVDLGTDTDQARQEITTYIVENGDTLSTIAHHYGLTSQTLVWANGMTDKDFIKPGQSLKIPPVEGYLYTVKKGDTLAKIARTYKGDQTKILDANHLASADQIQPDQDIIIPGGEPPAPPAPAPSLRRSLLGQVYGGISGYAPPSSRATGARFMWPTTGHHLNQYFRGRYHTGIDIEGTYASPIYAAAAGRVIFSAFDRSGYGLHVVIDHGNGYETLYGHASKVFVGVGERVKQGQTIAMIGSTGRSTGTHVHFEIRTGGGFLNPLSYL